MVPMVSRCVEYDIPLPWNIEAMARLLLKLIELAREYKNRDRERDKEKREREGDKDWSFTEKKRTSIYPNPNPHTVMDCTQAVLIGERESLSLPIEELIMTR
jgi:hypothetical protein